MKPRKVVVVIEMTTDATLKALRGKTQWEYVLLHENITVHQVQANVVKVEKAGKAR